ncbi:MAG: family 20 glycosylhydrolase [Planctomycetota bacterium]|nr:family 20 glycosylhydrolase [Planctomycetota bacterium]
MSGRAPFPRPREMTTGEPALELGPGLPDLERETDPDLSEGPQGYRLEVDERGARLTAADKAGFHYGESTFAQLVEASRARDGVLPRLSVRDRPSFLERGVMLDVSRDRVPTMGTLFELVDRLARWRINRLQLYTEHTFAYTGHERVWRGASPFTADEIRALDVYCRERFVELVPNQQSCGHLHRWLVHEPYRALAECPDGVEHPFSLEREPFSLCPTDPGSLALLGGLYDELLPCFQSRDFNVGLDETFDLGLGRSKEACREKGVGRVYLDFLLGVHALVAGRGRRMQFWADIVLRHPELVGELPRDVVPLLWGYEADHPFEREAAALAESGLAWHICPGTSSWQSIAGRTDNMLANVAAAARHGVAHGATGLFVTDWGDRGHWQPLPVSYPGFLYAAALGWNADDPGDTKLDLEGLLDTHAFEGEGWGRVVLELGRVDRAIGARVENGNAPFFLLASALEPALMERVEGLTVEGLERGLAHLEAALAGLPEARSGRSDAGLLRRELDWAAGLLRLACRRGIRRLGTIPAGGDESAGDLRSWIEEHRALWLARSRPGGLEASAGRLARCLGALE